MQLANSFDKDKIGVTGVRSLLMGNGRCRKFNSRKIMVKVAVGNPRCTYAYIVFNSSAPPLLAFSRNQHTRQNCKGGGKGTAFVGRLYGRGGCVARLPAEERPRLHEPESGLEAGRQGPRSGCM